MRPRATSCQAKPVTWLAGGREVFFPAATSLAFRRPKVIVLHLNHFDGIPNDVVLADMLEPKSLDADTASSNFGVPHKEAGGKTLAADFHPSVRVDAEIATVLHRSTSNDESGDGLCLSKIVRDRVNRFGGSCGFFLGWKLQVVH
jgi:hypothetical protein